MSTQNRTLSKRWYDEVWNDRRDESVDEIMCPDAVGHTEQGEMIGLDPFKQIRAQYLSAFPDLKFEIEAMISEGDQVAVRWLATGTHTGSPLAGAQPCGRTIKVRGTTWHRYENGVMVEGWDTWNLGALMQHVQEPPLQETPAE